MEIIEVIRKLFFATSCGNNYSLTWSQLFSGVIAKVGITDYNFCAWYVQPLYSRSTAAVLLGYKVVLNKRFMQLMRQLQALRHYGPSVRRGGTDTYFYI